MIKKLMQDRLSVIDEKIKNVDEELQTLPTENIFISKNGNYSKWYLMKDKKQVYIPKKQRSYAEKLVRRKYLLCHRQDLLKERDAIQSYLDIYSESVNNVEELFAKNPEYLSLLSYQKENLSKEISDWMNLPYPKSTNYSEHLTYETENGKYVRSKSELIIDAALRLRNLPFRYESPVIINGKIFHPDYTICDPATGKIYYYEHFGRIDDSVYREKMIKKLREYVSHDIIPGVNLIMTFETKEHPLDMATVNRVLDQFFRNDD